MGANRRRPVQHPPPGSELRVAVVVSCFDLGDYLPETLASLRAQTVSDWELVVVDDGSTDVHTLAVLDRLRADGVRVLRTANRGLSAARNLGIASTTAPILCMVDADDLLAPELFAKSLAVLDARPEIAFVSHWLEAFGAEQWEWRPASCDLAAMVLANQVNGSALVRRAAVEAVGGYDESMRDGCEDWDLWLTLLERGYRGEILPEILFRYRRRPDAMSAEMLHGARFARTCRYLAEKHAETYARHAKEAIGALEAETFHLLGHVEDLETGHVLLTRPETEKLRDDVADLERRAATAAEAIRREELRHRLEAEVEALEERAEASRLRGDQLEQRARELASELSERVADLGGARLHVEALDRERLALGQALRDAGDRIGHLEHGERHWREAFETARREALETHVELDRAREEARGWRAGAERALAEAESQRLSAVQLRAEAEAWRRAEELQRAESETWRAEGERWRLEAEQRSRELAARTSEAAAWREEAGSRQAEVESYRLSWSWRITAPLRAVARLARGGR